MCLYAWVHVAQSGVIYEADMVLKKHSTISKSFQHNLTTINIISKGAKIEVVFNYKKMSPKIEQEIKALRIRKT